MLYPTTVDALFAWAGAFANLERRTSQLREYRLDRMADLLELAGHPEHDVPCFHIAGSKGKGSSSAYLADTLSHAGYRVGVFRSPHIFDWRERIAENRIFFADHIYLEAGKQLYGIIEALSPRSPWSLDPPSTFEILTCLAFLCFRFAQVDIAVIEVGIGGRLDATNLVQPIAALITHLELEHTDVLGPSIEHIAWEKAGIFKINSTAHSAPQNPKALAVLRARAKELNCPFTIHDQAPPPILSQIELTCNGRHQQENALLVWGCLSQVWDQLPPLTQALVPSLSQAFAKALLDPPLPGRGTIYCKQRNYLMADGAHTVDSILASLELFHNHCQHHGIDSKRCSIVFGLVSGKREAEIVRLILRYFNKIIITRPGTYKQSDPIALAQHFINQANTQSGEELKILLEADESKAWDLVKDNPEPILILGSFHLLGVILPLVLRDGFIPSTGAVSCR